MTGDRLGRSAMHYAAAGDDVDCLRDAPATGADVSGRDGDGFTPLHFDTQEDAVTVTRFLLDHGAEVDATNKYCNTPLFTAVSHSRGDGTLIGRSVDTEQTRSAPTCMIRHRWASRG
jgi:uncharacterized protein